jgi:hypothetical protein
MARKVFNWSLLDRDVLYSMLYKAKKDIVGKRLAIDEINRILSKHIKLHLPVRVTSSRHKEAKGNEIWCGGMYHSDYDQKGHTRFIEVQLAYPPNIDSMKVTTYRWNRICIIFADIVLHEIIHTRQFRARNFKAIPMYQSTAQYAKDRKEQEYYGDRDEMGAHSFNMACDMVDKFGWDTRAIREYLEKPLPNRKRLAMWQRFLKAFDGNHSHPKVRQMKRKILKQLEHAYNGKPFRTTNYLTY